MSTLNFTAGCRNPTFVSKSTHLPFSRRPERVWFSLVADDATLLGGKTPIDGIDYTLARLAELRTVRYPPSITSQR
jgi:hypothetical protein